MSDINDLHFRFQCDEKHDLVRDFNGPRPTIVVLCGSTRFGEAFRAANLRETVAGRIVLSIGCDTKSDSELAEAGDIDFAALKTGLDDLHKRKIDLADEVYVLNVGGYVGESTQSEVEYAAAHKKPIRWLEGTDYRRAGTSQPPDIAAVLAGAATRPGIRPATYWEVWCTGDGSGEHLIEFGDYTGWSDRDSAESAADDGEHVLLHDGRVFCRAHIPVDVCPDSEDNRHEAADDQPDECAHCGRAGLPTATPQAVTA